MPSTSVLIVEDDRRLNALLLKELSPDFFLSGMESYHDLEFGLSQPSFPYDIVVLDRMMEGKDTAAILPALKEKVPQCRILILSAINTHEEKASILNLGADDYLSKPFSFAELKARLHALERRVSHEIRFANVLLNTVTRTALVAKTEMELSNKEFLFMQTLMKSPGKVFSKAVLLEHVWKVNPEVESNAIETTVNKLRRKLEEASAHMQIKNSRLLGYWIEE